MGCHGVVRSLMDAAATLVRLFVDIHIRCVSTWKNTRKTPDTLAAHDLLLRSPFSTAPVASLLLVYINQRYISMCMVYLPASSLSVVSYFLQIDLFYIAIQILAWPYIHGVK